MKMLGNNVLVTEVQKEATTAGGIILSADVKQTASEPGIILSVGPEATHLNKGDTVYLSWDKSMPVRIGGQDAAIIAAEHIKAVLS